MTQTYQTDEQDFKLFQRVFKKVQKKLGLLDYDVTFIHDDKDMCGENSSACLLDNTSHTSRAVAAVLNKTWAMEPSHETIIEAAHHEALELLLRDMRKVAWDTNMSEEYRWKKFDEMDNASHAVIHRLMSAYPVDPYDRD